jgi:hypothetical protein
MKLNVCIVLVLAMSFCFTHCAQEQQKVNIAQAPASDAASAMLRNFYTDYIIAFSDMSEVTEEKLSALKQQYCTTALITKIYKDVENGLDYDPILNAQDAGSGSSQTLAIVKDPEQDNVYAVSYAQYDTTRNTIQCRVVQQNGIYKVDAIW